MKTTVKIIVALFILTTLTTCTKWYEDMSSFEEVLTNGAWVIVGGYTKPSLDTPFDTSSVSDFDYGKLAYALFFYENGIAKNYTRYEYLYATDDYIINKFSRDTLSNYAGSEYTLSWEFKDNYLTYWSEDLLPNNETQVNLDLVKYKVIKYSKDKIIFNQKKDIIVIYADVVTGRLEKDTMSFDYFYEVKNVKNNYK